MREERTRDGPAANTSAGASTKTYKSAGPLDDSQLEIQTCNELGAASGIYARTMIPVFGIRSFSTCQILGIQFFNGDVDEAVASMLQHGGFLVAPSGTCFARLREDERYRGAVLASDLAIADSGLMVLLWRLLRRENVERISGFKYLRHLLRNLKDAENREVVWVLPSERAQQKLFDWSHREPFSMKSENCYVAPRYGSEVEDRALLALIEPRRPAHVIIAIGSGAQEKLGYYLRENLSYRPAIHCIGAALGFVTGDQAAIPEWADRFYLGWLWRLFAQPHVFIPRLFRAVELPWLIWKYGEKFPPMRAPGTRLIARRGKSTANPSRR